MMSNPNIAPVIPASPRPVTTPLCHIAVALLQRLRYVPAMAQDWDIEIDCEGLLCPLPVLRARKALISLQPGQILRLRATDRMAAIDLPHFCTQSGHAFLDATPRGDTVTAYRIRRS